MSLLPYATPASAVERPTLFTAGRWALFLGMSWTWCVGMFMPVLIVQNVGFAGWIAFAIPNVIGAAAVGFVFRDPAASEAFEQRHRRAVEWFSVVTVAFHSFFFYWLMPATAPWPLGPQALAALAIAVATFVIVLRPRQWPFIACVVAAVASVTVAAIYYSWGEVGRTDTQLPDRIRAPLAGIALACTAGFLTCPFLDLTLHRARRALPASQAKPVFVAAFAAVFLAMIVLTLVYSDGMLYAASAGVALGPVYFHLYAQIALTAGLHCRELTARGHRDCAVAAVLIGALLGVISAIINRHAGHFTFGAGEIVYRTFLGFYGVVFPAYLLLRAIPRRPAPPAVVVAVIAAALPFFAYAFLWQRLEWLWPGPLILILVGGAYILRDLTPPPHPAPPGDPARPPA